MEKYIRDLISGGESQQLDFKYCVTDSRKIARTLVAFANTDGGRILIGVRDNGSIAGIKTDEEIYMIDTAAHLYCRPEITYKLIPHTLGKKSILEVDVSRGTRRPYKVKDENGRWIPFFRHNDQNLAANRVLLQVWKKEEKNSGVLVKFGKSENILLEHLKEKGPITLSKFRKLARISAYRAESILANLIVMKVIRINLSDKGFTYELDLSENIKKDPLMPPDQAVTGTAGRSM
ncbi:MAG TPA: ATP-binding protein [Bacteroidales bacterium]|jgi:predicted HTH transcriptional regulator|nr:ATP-binding protein [Bacteroidales bacterium]HNR40797.1 ATP-binding protein [Bacteroidales bacterium]HQG76047.1 ATP-binding protein [Bacteroidales bacterium]